MKEGQGAGGGPLLFFVMKKEEKKLPVMSLGRTRLPCNPLAGAVYQLAHTQSVMPSEASPAVKSIRKYLKLSNRIRYHTTLHFIVW